VRERRGARSVKPEIMIPLVAIDGELATLRARASR
jgi:hypothetical protein